MATITMTDRVEHRLASLPGRLFVMERSYEREHVGGIREVLYAEVCHPRLGPRIELARHEA